MENSLKISIPTPCHEDWNKMTPNQQGAFCGKCCKTVVDFTNKTTAEIIDYFKESTGSKTCGKFSNDQLGKDPVTLNLNFSFAQFSGKRMTKYAFALAVFLIFGTTLFSCTTTKGEIVGDIMIENPIPDSIANKGTVLLEEDTTINTVVCETKGDVAVEYFLGEVVALPKDTVKKDTIKPEIKMGKIKIDE